MLVESVSGSGVTVCVKTRNSPRWFKTVRSEITPTGAEALNVNVPAKLGARNGDSLRNFAVCALPANTKLLCPKSFPFWSVKLNEIVTGALLGFAKATPVLTGLLTSAYVRPDAI